MNATMTNNTADQISLAIFDLNRVKAETEYARNNYNQSKVAFTELEGVINFIDSRIQSLKSDLEATCEECKGTRWVWVGNSHTGQDEMALCPTCSRR